MTENIKTVLTSAIDKASRETGLVMLSAEAGTDFNNKPTARVRLALTPNATQDHTLELEVSDAFDFNKPDLLPAMTAHLVEAAKRLRNPRPDAYVTLAGLPLSFSEFRWPFHLSTSGSDTHIVHGVVHLEDGAASQLHAKVSASMTVTFAEIVLAPEQPYAETFIYNAVRKTFDQGQLELVKSGNRQPVPVTTRYYSRWQEKFFFTETDDQARRDFLAMKVYWLSGVLGGGQPVWLADPRDAQYLNATPEDLSRMAAAAAGEGCIQLTTEGDFAAATPKLMERAAEYHARMDAALAITKPQFNEEMRHGHTNM